MTLFQTTYMQNLEAAGPLGSLLRSIDPLVDGEIAGPSSRTSNRFQSWSHFLVLWSSSADRRARRVMQKSLKALHGTELQIHVDGIVEDVLDRNGEER